WSNGFDLTAGRNDEILTRWNLEKILTNRVRGIDSNPLPHITVHDGRHTFAARTRQAGIPLEDIKDFLGHKDVSTTQVYAHISPEVKKRSMNQLENYIEEQIKKHSN
ncbi:tyrosine-type recombinase/integrase, partial [Enterococcus sp. GC40]|uniref:tyrosine-type recombinase/integrase n=1 Tax=Enterococcus sp. GC40 TaxID=3231359 RepID=UPI0034A02A4B